MLLIEKEWNTYNDTQRRIIAYLFVNSSSTLDEIVMYVKINENTVRTYLNKMIEDQIIERISTKLRDKNAIYQFRKNT